LAGLNIIQLSFMEMISGGDGFAFDYAAISPIITPLAAHRPQDRDCNHPHIGSNRVAATSAPPLQVDGARPEEVVD
jgi:hypothetical protein